MNLNIPENFRQIISWKS